MICSASSSFWKRSVNVPNSYPNELCSSSNQRGADAQDGPTAAHHVEGGDGLGEHGRIAVGVSRDQCRQLDGLGGRRQRGERRVGLEHRGVRRSDSGELVEVIHHECSVEACGFGFAGLRYDGGEEVLDRTAVAEVGPSGIRGECSPFRRYSRSVDLARFYQLYGFRCAGQTSGIQRSSSAAFASLGSLLVKLDCRDCDAATDNSADESADPGRRFFVGIEFETRHDADCGDEVQRDADHDPGAVVVGQYVDIDVALEVHR